MATRTEKKFSDRLLRWWAKNKRDFTWRKTRDPYKILLAEAMLRKTTSGQVAKVYERFLLKYPDPSSLLTASIEGLEKELLPLGIYKVRAAQLKKMARTLVHKHGGRVPRSKEELAALPGVKEYGANAVLCLAYEKNVPFLDTNGARVLQRVFGISTGGRLPQNDPRLWNLAAKLVPHGRAREFNLALLDIGAMVCTARQPLCEECPLAFLCKSAKSVGSGFRKDAW